MPFKQNHVKLERARRTLKERMLRRSKPDGSIIIWELTVLMFSIMITREVGGRGIGGRERKMNN